MIFSFSCGEDVTSCLDLSPQYSPMPAAAQRGRWVPCLHLNPSCGQGQCWCSVSPCFLSWLQHKYTTPSPIALDNIYPPFIIPPIGVLEPRTVAADKAEWPWTRTYNSLRGGYFIEKNEGKNPRQWRKISSVAIKSSAAAQKRFAVYLSLWREHALLWGNATPLRIHTGVAGEDST